MSQKPIVFLIRNKPSGMGEQADIINLCLQENRVFVGYPPFKKGIPFKEHNILSCTYDISKDDFTQEDIVNPNFYSRGVSKNKKLVSEVIPESFVIIPRPERGFYYIGKIKKFELVNDPKWIEDYKKIRLDQNLIS